jgi:exonuclease SbcC
MRPLKLSVEGFTCFRRRQEIDLSALDLFAITGPTGAGKTSLLDGLTYALYGQVPRVGDDTRQLISQGAREMRVHLEFSVGPARYRVTRVARRGATPNVALERWDGTRWESVATRARDASRAIAALVGLDFDGFTKAVLLPQGQFDQFLKGEPRVRHAILVGLLRLEIYARIQRQANHEAAAAAASATALAEQLATEYADASEEALASAREAAEAAARAVDRLARQRGALDAARELARQVREGRQRAAETLEGLEARRAELATAAGARDTTAGAAEETARGLVEVAGALDQVRYVPDRHLVLMAARGQASRLGEVRAQLARIVEEDRARAGRTRALEASLAAGQEAVLAAETGLAAARDAGTAARAALEVLEARHGRRPAVAAAIEIERRRQDDRGRRADLERQLAALLDRHGRLGVEIERDTTRANEAGAALDRAGACRTETAQEVTRLREVAARAGVLERALAGRCARLAGLRQDAVATATLVADARQRQRAAEQRRDDARCALEEATAVVDRLRQEHAAHLLRAALKAGAPCPVCDQPVHERPPVGARPSLDAAARDQARAAAAADAAAREAGELGLVVTAADRDLENASRRASEEEAGVAALRAELSALLPDGLDAAADWPRALATALDRVVERAGEADRRARDAREAVDAIAAGLARRQGERADLPQRIEETRRDLALLEGRLRDAEDAVALVLGRPPGTGAAGALGAIDAGLARAEREVTAAAAGVERAQQAVHEARGAREGVEQALLREQDGARAAAALGAELTAEAGRLAAALAGVAGDAGGDPAARIESEIASLDAARATRDRLVARRDDLEAERAARALELAGLESRLTALRAQVEALETRMAAAEAMLAAVLPRLAVAAREAGWPGGRGDDPDAGDELDRLERHGTELRRVHDDAVAERATLAARAGALAGRVERAADCRRRREEAQARADVAHELGRLLAADEFQTFLLREAVQVLAEDGSGHLRRLSGDRYTFRLATADPRDGRDRAEERDRLEFHVVDHWNADEARSVKTLSGGETFLASLALALALAGRLADLGAERHGREALESLFLDEGFGTLDPETLDTVTQALEALQTRARMVGIVTHLPELAERMPAQIRVVKTQAGSHVELAS